MDPENSKGGTEQSKVKYLLLDVWVNSDDKGHLSSHNFSLDTNEEYVKLPEI